MAGFEDESLNGTEGGISKLKCPYRVGARSWKLVLLIVIITIQSAGLLLYMMGAGGQQTETLVRKVTRINLAPARPASWDEREKNIENNKNQRRRLPHFMIIGVMKSGTGALRTFLKAHSKITIADPEIHYFDFFYDNGLEWYLKQLSPSYPDQLTGDRTPAYYISPLAPKRIHQMNSTIKLILIVREPVERCMSNYLQYLSNLNTSTAPKSFEASVLLEDGKVNPLSNIVNRSDYNLFIDNWLEMFDLSQLKVIDGKRLVTAPHQVMEELQDFLGIERELGEDNFIYDKKKGFFCLKRKPSGPVECLNKNKGREHPVMKPDTKQKLYDFFAPRNKIFFSKIGKSFDW